MQYGAASKIIVFLVPLVAGIIHLAPVFAQSSPCEKGEREKREAIIKEDDSKCLKSCKKAPDPTSCRKACAFMDTDAEKQFQKDLKREDCLTKF